MYEMVYIVFWWLAVVSFSIVFTCIGSVVAFYWFHSNLDISKCLKNIPCYRVFPIYTYLSVMKHIYRRKHPRAFVLQIISFYCKFFESERISLMWIGSRPIIFLYKPEKVEALLNNSITISKSVEYDFLKSWLGMGLLTSTGDKWRSHRKLLTPSFHYRILEDFLPAFNEQAAILTTKLESVVEQPWIDIVPLVTKCTLDTICQTAMGVRLNTQSGCSEEYMKCINEISDSFTYRMLMPGQWFDPIFMNLFPSGRRFRENVRRIHDFTKKVIKEKKEYMIKRTAEEKSEKRKGKAFLELLLEHHLKDDSFTEEHIREEVDTFMFEGHDTTAMSVCWTLYELGNHPDIQRKVYQELVGIFDCNKDRQITSDNLKQMKYLECTIKESLRLYPSVPFIARQLKEDLKIDDYTLKPGCTCLLVIFMLHMDPEQFPVPEKFDPDRFLPENCNRHPYAYIPFSAGPRNCIGQKFALMELKTVLAYILRKFKVTSFDPRDKIERMAGLILKNAEPIKICFELRGTEDT